MISVSPPVSERSASPGNVPGRLIANLFALVTARLQLAQIELEEAAHLALRRLGWLFAIAICGLLALQFAGLFLLLRYSGEARLWMVAGFALTFLVMTVIAIAASVRMARTQQSVLMLTRSEISDDLDALWRTHGSR